MSYAASNPFLDDLSEEVTADLIASGNLRKEKAKPEFIAQWTSSGYVARNERYSCFCGYEYDHIIGAFHKEKAITGQVRYTSLAKGFQIPLGQNFPIETTSHKIAVCPSCVSSKGFERLDNV